MHKLISIKNMFRILFLFSLIIQIVVISYNHFTNYYTISTFPDLILRVTWGSFLTLIASLILAYPDLFVIINLNKYFSWSKKALLRILIQTIITLSLSIIAASIITSISHSINNYKEGLFPVIITNVLIASVCNIILMVIFEAYIYFNEGKREKELNENLKEELSEIKFEVLKNQINPHFLFNSLNVLSSLIDIDTKKAQDFIDEFSHVYRYVLDTIDRHVVSLGEELDFARSYIFLQKIRYGKHLIFDINIPSEYTHLLLPPLSLQLILENALKHNIVNAQKPLEIKLYIEEGKVIIENAIQLKSSNSKSTGLGQKNLEKRYLLISNMKPSFTIGLNKYKAELPLIDTE